MCPIEMINLSGSDIFKHGHLIHCCEIQSEMEQHAASMTDVASIFGYQIAFDTINFNTRERETKRKRNNCMARNLYYEKIISHRIALHFA